MDDKNSFWSRVSYLDERIIFRVEGLRDWGSGFSGRGPRGDIQECLGGSIRFYCA